MVLHRGALLIGLLGVSAIVSGCGSVDPAKTTPNATLNLNATAAASTGSQVSPTAQSAGSAASPACKLPINDDGTALLSEGKEAPASGESDVVSRANAYVDHLKYQRQVAVNQVANSPKLQKSRVVSAVATLALHKRLKLLKSMVQNAHTQEDKSAVNAVVAKIDAEIARTKPESLWSSDFKYLYDAWVDSKTLTKRVAQYEADFFQSGFVDRFGTQYQASAIGGGLTDQQLANAAMVFLEAILDEFYQSTPVWDVSPAPPANGASAAAKAGPTYYPGVNTNVPSVLAFANMYHLDKPTTVALTSGCGMTPEKMQALNYLAAKAGTWTSAEVGIIFGFLGGANIGPAVVLMNIKFGDNQLLMSLAQSILGQISKRITFEATWPALQMINQQPGDTMYTILQEINYTAD